jgi:hypothetical protein
MRSPTKKDGADASKAYSGPHMVGAAVDVDFSATGLASPTKEKAELCTIVALGTSPTNMIEVKRPNGNVQWVSEGRVLP